MTTIIQSIADWAAGAGGFSPVARRRAVDAVIDTLACVVAGSGDRVVQSLLRAFAEEIGDRGAASVVGGRRTSASRAALVNGAAAHALDFDDNFRPARSHASAVLVPALLAAAERHPVSGSDFVTAYIVGLEAQAVVGRGVNEAHYLAGWHPTSTVATIGTAAGVARLLGLDAAGIAASMANAVSMAAGLKSQFGTAMKPVHAGLAARSAVDAALLAEARICGSLAGLDGPQGFGELYGGPDAPGWDQPGTIGAPLAIEIEGLLPKLYPCCGSTHYVLDAIYDLKRRHGFEAADIVAADVRVGVANFNNLTFAEPRDGMQARFSMQYCVALALLQDHLTVADFVDAAVMRPGVRRLLPVTRMTAHDAEADRQAAGTLPHQVHLALGDGSSLRAERAAVRGGVQEPFSDSEKLGKFRSCLAAAGVPAAVAGRHYDDLQDLADASDVACLSEVLAEAVAHSRMPVTSQAIRRLTESPGER